MLLFFHVEDNRWICLLILRSIFNTAQLRFYHCQMGSVSYPPILGPAKIWLPNRMFVLFLCIIAGIGAGIGSAAAALLLAIVVALIIIALRKRKITQTVWCLIFDQWMCSWIPETTWLLAVSKAIHLLKVMLLHVTSRLGSLNEFITHP